MNQGVLHKYQNQWRPLFEVKEPRRFSGAGKVERSGTHSDSYLPRISEVCILKVTFLLPPDKYPKNLPYGPDLDNLLKRFLDLLNETVFWTRVGAISASSQFTR
jgi:hypothetical protein